MRKAELRGRCTFEQCRLTDAVWANTYFKACRFLACSLDGARFEKTLVSGLRLTGSLDWRALLVDCDVRSLYLNDLHVAGGSTAV